MPAASQLAFLLEAFRLGDINSADFREALPGIEPLLATALLQLRFPELDWPQPMTRH